MRIEYIATQDNNDSFCNDEKSIVKLFDIDSDLTVTEKNITYGKHSFSINVLKIKTENRKHNYFNIIIETEGKVSENLIDAFTTINRKIVIMLENALKNTPKVLWDDLNSYYSSKAYPLLNEIENLMRKLLTKLLIIKVGINWESDNVPQDIKRNISQKNSRCTVSNYLSGTDFIDLTTFIFKKYSNTSNEVLFESISNCKDLESYEKIKKSIPKSNWERFLSHHIDINEKALSERWHRLYILRCAVAHNADFRKKDYIETKKLINEIKPILLKSIASLETYTNQPTQPEQSSVNMQEVNESLENNNDTSLSLLTSETAKALREQVSASEFLNLARVTPNLEHITRAAQLSANLMPEIREAMEAFNGLNYIHKFNKENSELFKMASLANSACPNLSDLTKLMATNEFESQRKIMSEFKNKNTSALAQSNRIGKSLERTNINKLLTSKSKINKNPKDEDESLK